MICTNCGNHCSTHLQDMGDGPSEFWGFISSESKLVEVSDCCSDPALDDDEYKEYMAAMDEIR
jgi:hypothetical protein